MRKRVPVNKRGLWEEKGPVIVPTKNGSITMRSINYPVKAYDNYTGQFMTTMMPGQEYSFPTDQVLEIPEMQSGGIVDEDYYKANASLLYYKEMLNNSLRQKNPGAYDNYFSKLGTLRKSGNQTSVDDFINNSDFNTYLSPDEIKSTLGNSYSDYLKSLNTIKSMNKNSKIDSLFGEIEGQAPLESLNYGRRFASIPVNPTFSATSPSTNKSYQREYMYNPKSNKVEFTETGDPSIGLPAMKKYLDKGGSYAGGGYFPARSKRNYKSGGCTTC